MTKQIKGVKGRKSTMTRPTSARQGAPRHLSAQQGKPTQPKLPHTPMQPGPQTGPESSLLPKDPLAPLSPEESKTRENNIAHMKHLKEAMKKGLEKWDEEIKKEKDQLNKACMDNDREKLKC